MKYIMMMHSPSPGPYEVAQWPKQDLARHMDFMKGFLRKLGQAGELVGAEALVSPDQAKLVSAAQDGKPITDGVFPEAKEFLAGYWIVDVASPERAYEIAAEASLAPGRGGEPLYMKIEVREVMSPLP
jgi:hypothetical protein